MDPAEKTSYGALLLLLAFALAASFMSPEFVYGRILMEDGPVENRHRSNLAQFPDSCHDRHVELIADGNRSRYEILETRSVQELGRIRPVPENTTAVLEATTAFTLFYRAWAFRSIRGVRALAPLVLLGSGFVFIAGAVSEELIPSAMSWKGSSPVRTAPLCEVRYHRLSSNASGPLESGGKPEMKVRAPAVWRQRLPGEGSGC